MRALLVALALAACAPTIDGPVERARAADAEDSAALARQLAALPGATSAHAVLHRAVRDPFTLASSPASAAVLVLVDDRTDLAATEAAARRLVHAAAPEVAAPELVVAVGAHRPALAKVGPFTVDARSKTLLASVLVAALAAIAGLAGYIAVQARGRSAQ